VENKGRLENLLKKVTWKRRRGNRPLKEAGNYPESKKRGGEEEIVTGSCLGRCESEKKKAKGGTRKRAGGQMTLNGAVGPTITPCTKGV